MHKKQRGYDVISLRIQLSHQGEPDGLPLTQIYSLERLSNS
jgi:hypothetical protein